ncbi:MAG: ornithine cyclodeaminase family protein [Candidatus Scalindua sp. AMX11]|nr:MAG: ornithine cyclodeaminase family protein [Candidatus Scalindua sp.]NOG83046.1 ornithine cyclodeaminase family protein [Planctomycetota bacterium]RZV79599.1 MAG: ornithine cyclodeaminase family protein [Candidatus Scalindua sp. SCAELEC01]TDE65241.1 MAG: ornithine cyclodeaminase family protein [Candidatus Scalindua sp. AMX11]
MTFIITAKEVQSVLTYPLSLKTVEAAFKAFGLGKAYQPPKSYLTFKDGDLRSMSAYINTPGMNIAGMKSVNVHPDNHKKFGLPTVMATILLIDPKSGFNVAILDGTYITNMRTGASGGVATKYLSRKESKIMALIGAGTQARTQLGHILLTRRLKEVRVHSRPEKSMIRFCKEMSKIYPKISFIPEPDGKMACRGADIITTTTTTRKPIIKKSWVAPGTHINGIGADASGKQELELALTKSCNIIIDEWQQASHSGEINVAVSKGKLKRQDVYAELGEIAAGKKKGRTSDDEITLFDSTGLAIQDVSTAYVVYKALIKKSVMPKKINLF